MPSDNYNYHSKLVNEWRTDLKPLNVDQPEGPSFNVNNTPPSTPPWLWPVPLPLDDHSPWLPLSNAEVSMQPFSFHSDTPCAVTAAMR